MSRGPVGVAIVGAGVISKQYLQNLARFPDLKVHAIADIFEPVAAERAAEFGIETHGGVAAALSHPDVEIVINLTIPAAHVDVALAAIAAGKNVWSEKPFALDRESGRKLLEAANRAGLRLGCAPDTFLGPGLQTARRMIERGDIGQPLSGLTLFQTPGPESWHPNPAFLFQQGAGPLFDIAPYYLTALVQTFGPIRKVAALSSRARNQRVIGSGPKAGEVFDVDVPTQVGALLQFADGGSAQSIFSFDSPMVRAGFVEITGSEATIALPDPNNFDGEIRIRRTGSNEWTTVPCEGEVTGRGVGVLDLAHSIRAAVPHRASGAQAFHIVDAMVAIGDSAQRGEFVEISSTAPATEALPLDWNPLAATLGE